MHDISSILRLCPVIPVLSIDDAAHAKPLAQALVAGGLRVLEVTLRTEAAARAIQEMNAVEGAIIGAGTVLNPRQCEAALAAGAQFIVSPGLTQPLAHAIQALQIPFLPGVATASEIMQGLDLGLSHFKFYPAQTSGGPDALKAFAGPFPDVRFCPTGGVTAQSAPTYFAAGNVLCVGGSWLAPKSDMHPEGFERIERRAREAARLKP